MSKANHCLLDPLRRLVISNHPDHGEEVRQFGMGLPSYADRSIAVSRLGIQWPGGAALHVGRQNGMALADGRALM
jgi:hypothetical protein